MASADLAQLVAHRTCNTGVTGSSPVVGSHFPYESRGSGSSDRDRRIKSSGNPAQTTSFDRRDYARTRKTRTQALRDLGLVMTDIADRARSMTALEAAQAAWTPDHKMSVEELIEHVKAHGLCRADEEDSDGHA